MNTQTLRQGLAFMAAVLVLSPGLLGAEAATERGNAASEYLVKAAFIYNFAQFIDWPAQAFPREDAPIVIGIVGQDPVGNAIDKTVADKKAKGRPFIVRRLSLEPTIRECHILFVSSSESRRIEKLREYIRSAPVLTVGESDGFARNGGIVNLVMIDKKISMEINVAAAKEAQLVISSKLLSLAKIIQ